MANRDFRSEVIDLVAHQCGLSRQRVQLSDRLLQDLDIEGDDAVDFFISVHDRFGTDLKHLHEHWSEHFGPEGLSCWIGLVFLPAAVIGDVLAAACGLSTFWGLAIAIALIVAWFSATRRWGPQDTMIPITVGDVVAAVEAGAWPSRPGA